MKSIIEFFVIAVLGFTGVAGLSFSSQKLLREVKVLALKKATSELVSMEKMSRKLVSRN